MDVNTPSTLGTDSLSAASGRLRGAGVMSMDEDAEAGKGAMLKEVWVRHNLCLSPEWYGCGGR